MKQSSALLLQKCGVVFRVAASASPGSLLEMQNLSPQLRPTESESAF